MLPSWKRTRRISSREWVDYALAQAALWRAVLAVKLRSRGRLLAYDSDAPDRDPAPDQLTRARELAQALDRAIRYGLLRPKCLARSVALHRLLRWAGIRGSRIRIGVRTPQEGGLTAHAWVTLADRVLGDDPRFVGRFTEIADARMAGLS
jgi:transglutaminase superfamily protein